MAALSVNMVFTPVGSHGTATQLQVRQAQPAGQTAPVAILPAPATTEAPVADTTTPATQAPTEAGATSTTKTHPCNHGFYVSQAAHGHKGGAAVSVIAQGNLGKDGNCTAPLPVVTAPTKSDHESSEGAEHESGD
ncbi:MAG: hypothetical protein NVS9B1_22100 [Candidatus Dormibacteraceae bacterium]